MLSFFVSQFTLCCVQQLTSWHCHEKRIHDLCIVAYCCRANHGWKRRSPLLDAVGYKGYVVWRVCPPRHWNVLCVTQFSTVHANNVSKDTIFFSNFLANTKMPTKHTILFLRYYFSYNCMSALQECNLLSLLLRLIHALFMRGVLTLLCWCLLSALLFLTHRNWAICPKGGIMQSLLSHLIKEFRHWNISSMDETYKAGYNI